MKKLRQTTTVKRHVLIVDDEVVNREILGNILSVKYDVEYADNAKEALAALSRQDKRFSLILLDLLMPVMDGFEFLKKRETTETLRRIPVIVMTSEKESEVRSLKLGAADFIAKPFDMPEVVLARCDRIVELYEDQAIIRQTERDHVSGLYTKDYFFEYIRQIELWSRDIPRDAIVFDIEQFHLVNEFCGRDFGDHLLAEIGEALEKELASMNAIACRADADTFYIFATHQENYDNIRNIVQNFIFRFLLYLCAY